MENFFVSFAYVLDIFVLMYLCVYLCAVPDIYRYRKPLSDYVDDFRFGYFTLVGNTVVYFLSVHYFGYPYWLSFLTYVLLSVYFDFSEFVIVAMYRIRAEDLQEFIAAKKKKLEDKKP